MHRYNMASSFTIIAELLPAVACLVSIIPVPRPIYAGIEVISLLGDFPTHKSLDLETLHDSLRLHALTQTLDGGS